MSDESNKAPTTPDKILNPSQDYVGTEARVSFSGNCLKQETITFNHGKLVNIYIAYEIERSVNISSYPTLENCLFGAVEIKQKLKLNIQDMVLVLIEKDLIQLVMKLEEM